VEDVYIKFLKPPVNKLMACGEAFQKCADDEHSHQKPSEQNKVVVCLSFLMFQIHIPWMWECEAG